ncbi:DUF484 family protein [Actibacterium pelagium]|uniref:Tyrosine recombinase XerC n=1 Tax=Actibacterium pelagium TaxID=2029103 RepID=A0A917ALD8_9RHOB|nr:DUF484 family protein [Actibacterium pelagium]GGE60453.1 tyrosine recombinase XerC [Actibacterium pelagium]
MTDPVDPAAVLRDRIIADPSVILEDQALMQALVAANDKSQGANVVDLRSVAMKRLESRLDQLEDTHRSVIAAAYDNMAGTNQIHRAILKMMDPVEFTDFLHNLHSEVAAILRVDGVRLVLEAGPDRVGDTLKDLNEVLLLAEPGFLENYLTQPGTPAGRKVVLRQMSPGQPEIYENRNSNLQSEALMRLDFGPGRLPGLLALASSDPHQFSPQQGADLLIFFAGVFERSMRHWLS